MDENGKTPEVEVVKNEAATQPADQGIVLARNLFPAQLPIIPLNYRPLFPKMTVPLLIDSEATAALVTELAKKDGAKYVGLLLRRKKAEGAESSKSPTAADLYSVGVIAEVLQVARAGENGPLHALLGAADRFRVGAVLQEAPHIVVKPEYVLETDMSENLDLKAYSLSVVRSIKDLVQLNPLHKEELGLLLSNTNLNEPGRLADFAAIMTSSSGEELQDVLETLSIRERLKKVLVLIRREVDISRIQVQIGKQIEEKISKQQREFFLREQLKAIKKELGLQKEGKDADVEKFEERLKNLKLTDEAAERVKEEIEKLRLIEPASPEFNVSRTYVDWLTILPWGVFTKDSYDIRKASRILNRDHYGLEDVKERILEFLSVGIMKGNISGSILCFVGPPGVGKTSIGQSIARSIGRNFYRFSVGGIRDEAEIKGHRRTYIGALPGKFIQVMKVCKSANPVIMLDEIDKIGASYQGDPASALLEVLDPEQNKDFLDHYLDVRFDLSNVFFICTANQLDTIPRPLLDRMEVITLAGYILQEKLEIARRYLIPKQLKAHGLQREQVEFTPDALREIVDGYAREPGVRALEKAIKKILRKSVREIVEGKRKTVSVDAKHIPALLGKRLFTDENLYKKPVAGVVMGLAWTSMGGDTLYIEATNVETGTAGFKQTGQLGSVMVESSEIAYTYVRSFLNKDETAREFFKKNYIHLHVPAGATPKDGPSAGITMAVALYSLVQRRPVRHGLAMTGELTLTGRVMPIGGVKEKTIAAKRAKVTNLIFPSGNKKDFDELPGHIKKGLKPVFVSSFRDALRACFEEA
jgi:ATP-dependent Lon protease